MKYTKAVVLGRFSSMWHYGHCALVRRALEVAKSVYIVIGSSECYPNTTNPMDCRTRISMIEAWCGHHLTNEEHSRIHFSGVPDFRYNEEKWKTAVREAISESSSDKVAMVAYHKDKDSYWIKEFGWDHVDVEPYMVNFEGKLQPASASFIRDAFLRGEPISAQLVREMLPDTTLGHMNRFTKTATYARLREERLMWDSELAKFKDYPYPDALNCCTADAVVVCNNHILLIQRKHAPGKNAWALPGGHKHSHETFLECALRELREEVKLKVCEKVLRGSIRDSKLFDHPKRSAEFSKPTMAYFIVLEPNNDGSLPRIYGAADDAKKARWVKMHEFRRMRDMMFDDHAEIVTHFSGV